MAVSDGQSGNAATFNGAFISRTTDSNTTGKVDLENVDAASGSSITNAQRELNSIDSFIGKAVNQAENALPTWTSSVVGTGTDDLKARAEALTAEFIAASGHTHDGTDGEGAKIDGGDLANMNLYWAEYQDVSVTAASGTSHVVTTEFSGKTAGGGASALGVITSAPSNRCEIRASDGTRVEDAQGQKVYARIEEAAGVWTLSFYTSESGVETAHSLSSQDLIVFYREVFDQATRPTIPADTGILGDSVDMTADVVDASASQRGVVSTGAQSFGGDKTLTGALNVDGATRLATGLTGVAKLASGVVSAGSVDLSSEVTGQLPTANGGTGQDFSAANGLVKLASGVMSASASVDLTSEVSGALPIANGGHGQTTATEGFDALAPTTTKGDLIVRGTSDNLRLGVGADGQVLVADSAEASGVKWAAAAGGALTWDKYSIPYTSFTAAAATETIVVASLAVKTHLHKVVIKTSTAFTGTGWTAADMQVKSASQVFLAGYDSTAAVADTNFEESTADHLESFATWDVSLQLDTAGGNVNAGTAGSVDVYLLTSALE